MVVSKVVVFLVILGICCGNVLNDLDELNSRGYFVKKIKAFWKRKDNGISDQCGNHMTQYIYGISNNTIWALKMFDATPKIPSGVMDGNIIDLGFFDECLSVEGISRPLRADSERIFGKYCIGTLPLELSTKTQKQLSLGLELDVLQPTTRAVTTNQTVGLQFGICIPKACSAKELMKIYAEIPLNMEFYDELCQAKSDQPELDTGAIATISFLGVVLWIMLFCTAYDTILHYLGKEPAHPVLIAFSILTNGKKLLTTSNTPNQISCLHGIRVISTMWVILGHRYVFQAILPVRNYLYVTQWMNKKAHMFILNAPLSVDTFFLMSGLVVAYMYMSAVSKGIKFNIISYYIHRYVRLTPVLAVIILIHTTLLKYFGSGPMYPSTVNPLLVDGCERYWWKTLLYIQNYGPQDSMCIPQSWYLCVDTQLFLLSPIILIPLKRWPLATLSATGILTVCTMIASFLTGWFFELSTSISPNATRGTLPDYMKWYYFATQTRAGPWLIGIVLGYYIFQVKQRKVRLTVNKGLILVIWAASLAVLCTCLFTGHTLLLEEYNKVTNSIHMALVRPAWAIALSWIIFACVIGYGGPVNWFLSLPMFQILSKFTYTLYLLHLQIIVIITAQMRSPPVFRNAKMMYAFWGDFAFTMVVAVVFTLAFESPLITIERSLFGRKEKKEVKPSVPEEERYVEKSVEIA